MADRPYHHGNLRAVLLAEAERTLREQGVEALSLRDLARQAGVSHAAPRRHFADRQALLDALAETGFARLGEEMRAAIDGAGEDYEAQLRAVATGYVRFAIRDPALAELMFAAKNAQRSAALREASGRPFAAFGDLIRQGQQVGVLLTGDPERLRLLLIATLQGIAALITAGKVRPGQADALIADAVALFTHGQRLFGLNGCQTGISRRYSPGTARPQRSEWPINHVPERAEWAIHHHLLWRMGHRLRWVVPGVWVDLSAPFCHDESFINGYLWPGDISANQLKNCKWRS